MVMENQVSLAGDILKDSGKPLKQRFRALFLLKECGSNEAIQHICDTFCDKSALLKHELAYCLGQIQSQRAIPTLDHILSNQDEEVIVRHEAAEALGAIGSLDSLPILKKYSQNECLEIVQSCQLAIARIQWFQTNTQPYNSNSRFLSIDPAPPYSNATDPEVLKQILLDEGKTLFERYRALFTLRNLNSTQAIGAICQALKQSQGTLLKHEIGFVLGQLQNCDSIGPLVEIIQNPNEHEMVRHECIEALGSIGTAYCLEILNKYQMDQSVIVRESCEIGLDISDYEKNPVFCN